MTRSEGEIEGKLAATVTPDSKQPRYGKREDVARTRCRWPATGA
jgi:hypothetical protein